MKSEWRWPNSIESDTGSAGDQSRRPSLVTLKTASPSGRLGLSTRRAILRPPLDFLRYRRNVLVPDDVSTNRLRWVPPHCIGFGVNLICHQNKCIIYISQLFQIFEMSIELLLPGASIPRPRNSALKWLVSESTMISLTSMLLPILCISSTNNIWCAEL